MILDFNARSKAEEEIREGRENEVGDRCMIRWTAEWLMTQGAMDGQGREGGRE